MPRPGPLPRHPEFCPLILGRASARPEEMQLEEMLSVLALLLCQLSEEAAPALESHITGVEIEAQREVGVGGPQMQVGLTSVE